MFSIITYGEWVCHALEIIGEIMYHVIDVYYTEDTQMEVNFPATDEALNSVNAFVESQLEAAGCTLKNQMKIMVALEELFVNIAHYAYGDEEGTVTLSIDFPGKDVVLSLKDSGKPFDPLIKSDPDVTLSAEERDIGGLGIFMVKKSMDDVSYRYENGQNIITIRHQIV